MVMLHAPRLVGGGQSAWVSRLSRGCLLVSLTESLPPLLPPSTCSPPAQVTRAVFEAAKGRLKVVGRAGVGVDNVDLAAATEVCYVCSRRDRGGGLVNLSAEGNENHHEHAFRLPHPP